MGAGALVDGYVAGMPTSPPMPPDAAPGDDGFTSGRSRAEGWALAVFALGYNLFHHNSVLGQAAGPGGTRIADWVDLLTPFAVVLPLLWFLWVAQGTRRGHLLLLAAVGAVLYVEGHGIHLSANSIANALGGEAGVGGGGGPGADTAHLWDEVAGHYIWYLGLAVLLAVCALSVRGRRLAVPPLALAVGGTVCGFTWATNGLEGGTAVFSLACAVGSVALVDRRRSGLSVAILAGAGVAVAVLSVYGVVHGGFPQPSSL